MSAIKPIVSKQSLIDWSISLDGKNIGHITKEYIKGNSGPYTFKAKAFGFLEGKRAKEWDYVWEVVMSFQLAKNLIIEFNAK